MQESPEGAEPAELGISTLRLVSAIETGDADTVRAIQLYDPSLVPGLIAAGRSPSLIALYAGHRMLADELAAHQHQLSVFEAAAFDDTARLVQLIEADRGLIDSWNADGWQPLHLAAMFGRAEAARALLDADAAADEPGTGGRRPLHLAAAAGQLELVWILIASDADVNGPDHAGNTPLALATEAGDPGSVTALLAAGAR